jgi:hypothetical protein
MPRDPKTHTVGGDPSQRASARLSGGVMTEPKEIVTAFWRLDDRLAGRSAAADAASVAAALDAVVGSQFVMKGEGYALDSASFRQAFSTNLVLYRTVATSFESLIAESESIGFHLVRSITFAEGACFPGTAHPVGGKSASFEIVGIARVRDSRLVSIVQRTDNLRRSFGVPA